jgi:NAD(P)-dependent dehydrogenase (short-subunit alcohol dehydrogenase family)
VTWVAHLVRWLRPATDLVVACSFNRMGFEWNRRGFDAGDLPQDAGGRVALVTGANSGIGRATARELAHRGFDVWLLCRDAARGQEARDSIAQECGSDRVHLGLVDLSSLGSIRRFVQDFTPARVDVLVHNAGVLPHGRQLSADGVELTFATNVLGPFALTTLLMGRLAQSDDARVIFVASGGMYLQRLDLSLLDADPAAFDGTRAYANAKRAVVILSRVLAERSAPSAPITFASMHPGWVDTTALRTSLPTFHAAMGRFLRTPEQGADTVVWLAASGPGKRASGKLWFDRRIAPEYPLPWTRESVHESEQVIPLCENLSGMRPPLRGEGSGA